jgi:phospholipase C
MPDVTCERAQRVKIVATTIAVGTLAALGCSSGSRCPVPPVATGTLQVHLQSDPVVGLATVPFELRGNDSFVKSGTLGLHDGTNKNIESIPPGDAYALTISATTSTGAACLGGATVDVRAHHTTTVAVRLVCHIRPRLGNEGANICPVITGLAASPAEIAVGGGATTLIASARDDNAGPSPLTYRWSADNGTFSDPSARISTFTCGATGTAHITLTVSDGDGEELCPDAATLDLTCLPAIGRVQHIVVIYLENHSFDNLFGDLPGVEGRPSPPPFPQLDGPGGVPYVTLPQTDAHLPATLPNLPFDITAFVPANMTTRDLVHRFYPEQQQINHGTMDLFTYASDAQGLTMGYYPSAQLPIVELINRMPGQTTICDHFFHAAFGGSFLNHHWLIAAASPVFPNAPPELFEQDANGILTGGGSVNADGFAVDTAFSANTPSPAGVPPEQLMPNQTNPTIGDRLSEAGISWAWYASGWNDAIAGTPDPYFEYHHQPFVYYATYADGTAAKAEHLKDEIDFRVAAAAGTLPAVSFVKPLGSNDEHPGLADLLTGERHTVDLINAVRSSPNWDDTVVIVTYDENGGFWDHVAPPATDAWGPGTRVPTIVFSPFAKGGVDTTTYDTTAILKLIESRWGLKPLSTRDAAQADLGAHALSL